eukprot:scaffold11685_cov41-Attheya_sp.AAC.1
MGPWITKHLHPRSLLSKSVRQGGTGVLRHGVPVIWDTGASISITPDHRDFVGHKGDHVYEHVQGMGDTRLRAEAVGWIRWYVPDDRGGVRAIELRGYWVPDAPMRLLSTTSLLQHYPGEHNIIVTADQLKLTSDAPYDQLRFPVTVQVNPQTNLPTSIMLRDGDHPRITPPLCLTYPAVVTTTPTAATQPTPTDTQPTAVHSDNFNLSNPQKELLRWHTRLGHVGFKRIQYLLRTGVLGTSDAMRRLQTAASKLITVPKCASCLFGKQKSRTTPGRRITHVRDETGHIR